MLTNVVARWLYTILVLLISLATLPASAATINATSCSQSHVQAAINTAVSGDVVAVPGGSCTWSTSVSIPDTKGITLDGGGATIDGLLLIDMNSTTSTRVTDFVFSGGTYIPYDAMYLEISGSNSDAPFRIDNSTFVGDSSSTVLAINGLVQGLIDNNAFSSPGASSELIHNRGAGNGNAAGWAVDVVPGSADAVYFEDNTFEQTGFSGGGPHYAGAHAAMQNYYGARVVFRYNTMTMTHFDVHGTPGQIGGRWWEVYENNQVCITNGNISDMMALRGGSGVAFNNTATEANCTGFPGNIVMREEDTGTYPLLYQIGRGKNQALDPAYFWGNEHSVGVSEGGSYIQENRDYYLTTKGGYTPFTYPYPLTGNGMPDPTGTSDTEDPTNPTGLAANAVSSSAINLTWTASTDNVGVAGYNIERCTGAACSNFSQIDTSPTNSYGDSGLSAETLYRYQVSAYDAAANTSGYSNIAEDTTDAFSGLADCAEATVQAAINASNDGDTIECPAGSWSWSNLDIVNHDITLQGAGIDSTNITITSPGGIEATASNTKAFRVTGFTFASNANFGTDNGYAMMRVQGGKGWRIDNNKFEIYSDNTSYDGGNGIYTDNDVAGLIDNNTFTKGGGAGCMHAAVYVEGDGNNAWTDLETQLGAFDHTVFIEDNFFDNPDRCTAHNAHALYQQQGGIAVFRHNTINTMNVDNHGFCAIYAGREFEISNNTWGAGGGDLNTVLHIRGGTGVIYNNDWSAQNPNYGYWWQDYRAESLSCSYGGTSFVPGYGNVAANQSCPEGYPCAQQLGRGKDNGSDPMYVWNNTGDATINNSAGGSYIQENRDYYLTSKPGYTPYTYPHPLQSGDAIVLPSRRYGGRGRRLFR